MLTIQEIILRLTIAAILGAIIGFEREKHSQPAGLRTHMILTIGAALAMCVSIEIAAQYKTITTNGDPERIAAQVVSGIGFLGAGAIFRFGSTVKGLTTAVGLWTMAIVGLAAGGGYLLLASAATTLVLIILVVIDILEKRFVHSTLNKTIIIHGTDRIGFINEIKELLQDFNFSIKTVGITKHIENNLIEVEAITKIATDSQNLDKMIGKMSKIDGLKKFTIH